MFQRFVYLQQEKLSQAWCQFSVILNQPFGCKAQCLPYEKPLCSEPFLSWSVSTWRVGKVSVLQPRSEGSSPKFTIFRWQFHCLIWMSLLSHGTLCVWCSLTPPTWGSAALHSHLQRFALVPWLKMQTNDSWARHAWCHKSSDCWQQLSYVI